MRQHESKKDQTEKRRRRRDGPIGEQEQQLALPEGFEKDPDFEYRWANDSGTRLHNLTEKDDWDFVSTDKGNDGTRVSKVVGAKKDGTELTAFLVKKSKKFAEEDRAEKHRRIDEREGRISKPLENQEDALAQSGHAYVPISGISVARD